MEINTNLFGFRLGRSEKDKDKIQEKIPSPVTPVPEDAEMDTGFADGFFGSSVFDISGNVKNEIELINKYRELSLQPEAERAIDEIVNETIVIDDLNPAVSLNLEDLDIPNNLKEEIIQEFENILKLLDFQTKGYDIFKNWYIDGRLNYHKMINVNDPSSGLQELRYIDPRKIRKVREEVKADNKQSVIQQAKIVKDNFNKKFYEYFVYNDKGIQQSYDSSIKGVNISKDSICYVHSGILNENNTMILSHLHKAIKPHNQLRWLEDAVVIYRLSRAPERRLFYIDVGNLPKNKAEQYMRDMMARHRTKLNYDASTGEIKDKKRIMTMTEDYFLARREGGRGTEITTLPGGENLGEMEDVEFFLRKFYKSLNVPTSRLEQDAAFNLGRASEITRDEIKFQKFIYRLRTRFSMLFDDLLETQLILKGITDKPGWNIIKRDLKYNFNKDNYFTELKELEMNRERFSILTDADSYVGRYYSVEWVRRNILRQSDDDIKELDKQIEDEKKNSDERDDNFGSIENNIEKEVPNDFENPNEPNEPKDVGNFKNDKDEDEEQKEKDNEKKEEEFRLEQNLNKVLENLIEEDEK